MTIKELIKIEESLLRFEMNNKFDIDFNTYLMLEKYIEIIGKITDKYFFLVNEYNKEKLSDDKMSFETKKEKLEMFNEKILNSNVNIMMDEIYDFIKRNNIK